MKSYNLNQRFSLGTNVKLKLKTFSNWMETTIVRVGDKIIKLREERELFARCLIIQRSRPELVP